MNNFIKKFVGENSHGMMIALITVFVFISLGLMFVSYPEFTFFIVICFIVISFLRASVEKSIKEVENTLKNMTKNINK